MRSPCVSTGLLLLAALLLAAAPALGDRERPGLLRGIIDGIAPGGAEELEAEARSAEDGEEALRLYTLLQARHADRPEGVRAALWVGLWAYAGGDLDAALDSFERARRHAEEPALRERAEFWCEQTRFLLGGEPLPGLEEEAGGGTYDFLRRLVRVDRSIRAGRRGDGEASLLSLEGASRRARALPLLAVRWNDLLSLPGAGRGGRESGAPFLAALQGVPEQVFLTAEEEATPAEANELWSIQFGVFLDEENAKREVDRLREAGRDARIDSAEEDGRVRLHVRVGSFATRAEAESLAAGFASSPDPPPLIVQVK